MRTCGTFQKHRRRSAVLSCVCVGDEGTAALRDQIAHIFIHAQKGERTRRPENAAARKAHIMPILCDRSAQTRAQSGDKIHCQPDCDTGGERALRARERSPKLKVFPLAHTEREREKGDTRTHTTKPTNILS